MVFKAQIGSFEGVPWFQRSARRAIEKKRVCYSWCHHSHTIFVSPHTNTHTHTHTPLKKMPTMNVIIMPINRVNVHRGIPGSITHPKFTSFCFLVFVDLLAPPSHEVSWQRLSSAAKLKHSSSSNALDLWQINWKEMFSKPGHMPFYMGISENRGTPKSSILIRFSIINRPFWGFPIFWKHPYIAGSTSPNKEEFHPTSTVTWPHYLQNSQPRVQCHTGENPKLAEFQGVKFQN